MRVRRIPVRFLVLCRWAWRQRHWPVRKLVLHRAVGWSGWSVLVVDCAAHFTLGTFGAALAATVIMFDDDHLPPPHHRPRRPLE